MRQTAILYIALLCRLTVCGQQVAMTGTATLDLVRGEAVESEGLLPMNDLDMGESGYALYSAEVSISGNVAIFAVENVRDYAAVYLGGVLQGTLTDDGKQLELSATPGTHRLDLYVENIGRITYGPEILDNHKGLFGSATLDGEPVGGWTITPLLVRDCDVEALEFSGATDVRTPCFYRGFFELDQPCETYLNISGWGMGEVWVNGRHMGSFWEQEKQQSIMFSADDMAEGCNEIIVFEMKSNGGRSMRFSPVPVFK